MSSELETSLDYFIKSEEERIINESVNCLKDALQAYKDDNTQQVAVEDPRPTIPF